MKNKILIIFFLFFSISLKKVFGQNDDRLKGLDNELNKVLKSLKETGFAVAIVEKDKMIYAKGFGYRDHENKILNDENTLFAIGSCTKAFTSSILGVLRGQGKLNFEDSPIDHVKELRFYNGNLNEIISIRDLMSHRTGIPRHDFSWYFFPTFSKDSLIKRISLNKNTKEIALIEYPNNKNSIKSFLKSSENYYITDFDNEELYKVNHIFIFINDEITKMDCFKLNKYISIFDEKIQGWIFFDSETHI